MSSAQTRELTITTRKGAGREVSVAVQDSGCGLTADQHKYLFQPFYSTKPSGLGLGMSICRVIVEKHGGRLWAVPGVSEGAIFQFTVPEYPNSHGPVAGKGRNA
jgi:signal transduction histidine kinase